MDALENLRRHIDRASHAGLEHLRAKIIDILREPKVADLVGPFIDEDVSRLEIAVYYFFADEFSEATEDLSHDFEDFIFFEFSAFHEFLEVAVFAELGDDVEAVFGAQHIFELYYVRVVESLEKVDLREDRILKVFIVSEGGEVDLFDGYFFLALALHPFVDLAVHSLPQALRCLVRVVAYHLYHHLTHI